MINLAGKTTNADAQCLKELNIAKIKPVFLENRSKREVNTFIEGKLSFVRKDGRKIEIDFYRAWYYWVANGLVPLDVAEKLYATEIGKEDIRVKGDCGCPPPSEWIVWRKNQKEVVIDPDGSEEREYTEHVKKFPNSLLSTKESPLFLKTADECTPYIESYHIDSQEGLNLFVMMLEGSI